MNLSFFSPPGGAAWIAVDGGRISWINVAQNAIGRANVDGSAVNPTLVTGLNGSSAVTADSTHV